MSKKIPGSLANHLITAVEHAAHLARELHELRWSTCYGEGANAPGYTHEARKHCRKIIHALEMFDFILKRDGGKGEDNVVNIEEKRV
jgi:hypothetical protein